MQPTTQSKTEKKYLEVGEDVDDSRSKATLNSTMPDKNKLGTNDLTKQTLEDELSLKENHALTEGNTQYDDGKGQVNEGASTSGITPKKDEKECVSPTPKETCSEYDSSDLTEWSSNDRAVLGNMSDGMASTTREVKRNEQTKCGRCSEYVVKIVQLKKEWNRSVEEKEEKRILKQENEKLKSQLSDRNQTDLLLQHILDENKDFRLRRAHRDFEEKLKLSEEKLQKSNERNFHLNWEIDSVVAHRIKIKQELDEKIKGLEKDKKSLSDEVCDLKKELEETKKNVVRERQESKTAMIQVAQKFQEEKEKLTKIVNGLEQKYKDSMKYVIRERQKEKTGMNETIEKLQEENQTQAQKIVELRQELKLSKEKLQKSNERNIHLKCEIDSVVTDRIKTKQELNEKIQGLEKDKKSLSDEVCDLKKELCAMLRTTNELEAVAEERDRATAQLERIQIHNAALLDVINRFQERMQAAGQDDQALRNELHEMDILLLRAEDDQVHVPD